MASFVDENISPNQCFSLPKPVDGYPKLADHMGSSPEISIFKRFVALNRQNLLYLQAELTSLERRLRNVEAHSANCDPTDPRSHYSRDWEWMKITDEKSTLNPQWQLFGQIRGVLKEYSEQLCDLLCEDMSDINHQMRLYSSKRLCPHFHNLMHTISVTSNTGFHIRHVETFHWSALIARSGRKRLCSIS